MRGDDQTYKRDGWSSSDVLTTGTGTTTGTPKAANPLGRQVKMQADLDSKPYVITFNLQATPGQGGAKPLFMAEAVIDWTIEGNNVRRRVSLRDGMTISGSGQSVSVNVYDVTPTANPSAYSSGPFTANLQYTVNVQMCEGIRAPTAAPPLLVPPSSVVGAGSTGTDLSPGFFSVNAQTMTYAIPQDAGITAVMVVPNDPAAAGATTSKALQVFCEFQNSVGGFDTGQFSPTQWPDTWIPIPPGTDQIKITGLGAGVVNCALYYAVDG